MSLFSVGVPLKKILMLAAEMTAELNHLLQKFPSVATLNVFSAPCVIGVVCTIDDLSDPDNAPDCTKVYRMDLPPP
jgi:hypothetical protein